MAEPLKATFFTLKRRDRAVLLPATLVFVVLIAIILAAFVALNWNTLVWFSTTFREGLLQQAQGQESVVSDDPNEALAFIGRIFGFIGSVILFLFPLYIIIAAYEAACLRWMIRGEAPGLFGLTLNGDTWRVYGIYWCWFIGQFAVGTAMSILTMPLVFMSMGEIMSNPTPEAMWRWQLQVQLPIALLQYLPMIYLGVRFGPAAATSVLRRRFSPIEAWEVTRNRFWELFGSYAVWAVVVTLIWAALTVASIFVHFGGSWESYIEIWTQPPTPEKIEEVWARSLSPIGLIWMVADYSVLLTTILIWALMSYGVNARAALAALEEGKISMPADVS